MSEQVWIWTNCPMPLTEFDREGKMNEILKWHTEGLTKKPGAIMTRDEQACVAKFKDHKSAKQAVEHTNGLNISTGMLESRLINNKEAEAILECRKNNKTVIGRAAA